jgi:hypothetical protein
MSAWLVLLAWPVFAFAQQTTPANAPRRASPPPRPIVVSHPDANYQRAVQQRQVENQLQKNAMQQQVQQNNANQVRNATNDAALRTQQDNAAASQQRLDQAKQQDVINRYRSLPTPTAQPVERRSDKSQQPAKPSDNGQ